MTSQDAARLLAEIRHERENLSRVADAIAVRKDAADETATYALALLLMNYYTGTERIFQRVASVLGGLPRAGDRWHAQLLEDMSLDIPGVRPAVLRASTTDALQRFLGFRHVIRNLYAWTIRRDEMDVLVRALPEVSAELGADLDRFGTFLEASADR